MNKIKEIKNEKGFTLVEIIISIAFFCIICAVALRLFVLSETLNEKMQNRETASLMAINLIEVAKAAERPDEIDYSFSQTKKSNERMLYGAYYDKEWALVKREENPVFYMEMSILPPDNQIIAKTGFGPKAIGVSKIVSGLYFIQVEVGYMEDLNENIVFYKTAKHYVFREGK